MPLQKRNNDKNQAGLVSITVTLIIMLVLSLMVLGFARITRREQRQALDRQLSTQAYYAAETGINDVVNLMRSGTTVPENNSDCRATIDSYLAGRNRIDGPGGVVSYTCLFVDPSPPSLEYGSIDTNTSKVIYLRPEIPGPINNITINWQDKEGGTNLSGCNHPQLPPANSWNSSGTCNTGIMRVDLVPLRPGLNREAMIDSTMTVFLYPTDDSVGVNSGPYTSGFGNQGNIINVNCNATPKQCRYTINTGVPPANEYMMRLKSIYRSSAATITASRVGLGNLDLTGTQAIVDATGKASDVLRRIQVRVPISAFNSPYPEFAVQAVDTLCKKFGVAPLDNYFPDGGTGPNNPCDLLN